MAKFEIERSQNGNYYYHLKAGNHEIVLRGTQYNTKPDCQSDINAVKANAAYDSRYDRLEAVNEKYYFNLKDSSGNIVGTSQMYKTKSSRDHGIGVVKEEAPGALVYDLS